MVSRQQIMLGVSIMSFVWAFCFMTSTFVASQKHYTSPDYEGKGTERMFKVDYGTTFTGVTTSFAALGHFYFTVKQLKGAASDGGAAKLVGATMMMVLMSLQAAIVYGNELLVVQELDGHKDLEQACGSNTVGCTDICENGLYYIRYYKPNMNLKGTLTASVLFSVFLLLSQIVLLVLMHLWRNEFDDPDHGFDSVPDKANSADATYQSL